MSAPLHAVTVVFVSHVAGETEHTIVILIIGWLLVTHSTLHYQGMLGEGRWRQDEM